MPSRKKEAIPFFQILTFRGKSIESRQNLDARIGQSEEKQK